MKIIIKGSSKGVEGGTGGEGAKSFENTGIVGRRINGDN